MHKIVLIFFNEMFISVSTDSIVDWFVDWFN